LAFLFQAEFPLRIQNGFPVPVFNGADGYGGDFLALIGKDAECPRHLHWRNADNTETERVHTREHSSYFFTVGIPEKRSRAVNCCVESDTVENAQGRNVHRICERFPE